MGAHANERAREIYKSNAGTMILVAFIYAFVNGLTGKIQDEADFFVISIVCMVITSIVSASSATFEFRTFNRGTADTADCFAVFKGYGDTSKLVAIALVQTAILVVTGAVTSLFDDAIFLSLLVSLGTSLISILFAAVWFLYVANPGYNTADYFKASAKYIGNNFWGYFGFVLGHVGIIFLVLIIGVMLTVVGLLLRAIFVMLYAPYMSLAIAGYVSYLIPDEWYRGTAQF